MGDLKKLFEDQQLFNQLIWDKKTLGEDEHAVVERLRHLTLGIVEESMEFIRTFEFKVHRRRTKDRYIQNIAHSHEELIDMFKYWLSLADAAEFPIERLEELYFAKSRVVQYRYQEEWQKQVDRPVVLVDIDNVLADYITGICQWARSHADIMDLPLAELDRVVERLKVLQASKTWVTASSVDVPYKQWQRVKHHFRVNGGKRDLPVFNDARPFLDWCRRNKWLIVLITSRPIVDYPNLFSDTLTWLTNNNLPFDYVWWAMEKGDRLEEAHVAFRSRVLFAVDDDERYVYQYRFKGIKAYHLDRSTSYNDGDPTHDQFHIHSLHDLMAREAHDLTTK